jgi:formate dehydrogenase assembly factor FdhD
MSQSHSLFEAYQAVYTPQEQDDYQLVLDYLVSEGYVDDADEAELVIEQLEDDVIDGILDEVKGCGGKVNPDNGDYENGSGSARMMLSPRKKALAMARRKENEATTPQHQRQAAKMRRVASNMKEELDTYDLVLDYLLSEGFADNEEAALQIMSNMSEEWREEVVSHYVNS